MSRQGDRRSRGVASVGAVLLSAAVLVSGALTTSVSYAEPQGAVAGSGRGAAAVISAGYLHACARLEDGTVKCWGYNDFGQLGQGHTSYRGDGANEMGDNLATAPLGFGRTAIAITAGAYHTCALLDNGTVKCWGDNFNSQLGQGDTTIRGDGANEMGDNLLAINLGAGRTATAVSAGDQQTCALLDNGTVKCWGYNVFGQLGLGDTNNRGDVAGEMGDNLPAINLGSGRTATAVAAGSTHTCALLDNGTVKCWGYNVFGQLGLGDTSNRGDAAGEMGDSLPPINLGAGRTAIAITAGALQTCALLDNGTAKCWGYNALGQLGQGDTNNRGDAAGEMGDSLPPINLGAGRTAMAVTAGGYQTCALLDNGTAKCWGNNNSGQLGQSDVTRRGDGANEMGDFLPRSTSAVAAPRSRSTGGRVHVWVARQRHREMLGPQRPRESRLRRHQQPGRQRRRDGRRLGCGRLAQLVERGSDRCCTGGTVGGDGNRWTAERDVGVVGAR